MASGLAGEDVHLQLQTGLWCLEKNLVPEGFEHIDLALRHGGQPTFLVFKKAMERAREKGWIAPIWRALAAASTEQAECKSWLVHGAGNSPGRALVAELALDAATAQARAEACRLSLQSPRRELRRYVVSKLSSWVPEEQANPMLFEKTLCDGEDSVREAAVVALKGQGSKETAPAFLPFLQHPKPTVRIRAAEALGSLGEAMAIPSLIASLSANQAAAASGAEGGAARAYAFFGTQQAYVRDFDVQIAQAAVIAKPVVGILRHGSVIDVRVLGVSEEKALHFERQVLRRVLVRLAGQDLGPDAQAWQSWWSQKRNPKTGA